MTSITEVDSSADSTLIKTDKLGRMRTSRQRREMLLDEFEQSGLSGAEFARLIGIKYQTFAGWRQRRSQRPRSKSDASLREPDSLRLIEAVVAPPSGGYPAHHGLMVHLPGGAKLELSNASQVALAGALLRSLQPGASSC